MMLMGRTPTTQTEREEALLLLASLRNGDFLMSPEPRHVAALLELLEDDSHLTADLPGERWGLPVADREQDHPSPVTVAAASEAA
jgi:hypothetical protein